MKKYTKYSLHSLYARLLAILKRLTTEKDPCNFFSDRKLFLVHLRDN